MGKEIKDKLLSGEITNMAQKGGQNTRGGNKQLKDTKK